MTKKKIIFDVGNVLLSYRWHDMLIELGINEEDAKKIGQVTFEDYAWKEMDLGVRSLTETRDYFMEKYPEIADGLKKMFDNPQMMPVARPRVWERVEQLKEAGYDMYILSNYGKELFECHTGPTPFIKCMKGMVVSYQLNIAKPDHRIYEVILNKYNLKAEECIFLDDRPENVEAAKEVGIEAYIVSNEDQVIEVLKDF